MSDNTPDIKNTYMLTHELPFEISNHNTIKYFKIHYVIEVEVVRICHTITQEEIGHLFKVSLGYISKFMASFGLILRICFRNTIMVLGGIKTPIFISRKPS